MIQDYDDGIEYNLYTGEGTQLILPESELKKHKRKLSSAQPLQTESKFKVVELSKPELLAFNTRVEVLTEQYLGQTTQYANVLKFEDAYHKLCEEFGLTGVVAVTGEGNVILDTEEHIEEVAGDLEEYQMISDAVFLGEKVKDDISIFFDPNATDKDLEILE